MATCAVQTVGRVLLGRFVAPPRRPASEANHRFGKIQGNSPRAFFALRTFSTPMAIAAVRCARGQLAPDLFTKVCYRQWLEPFGTTAMVKQSPLYETSNFSLGSEGALQHDGRKRPLASRSSASVMQCYSIA